MNFIPPACLLDESSPVQYVPKEDRPTGTISTPKLRRKKSLASLWNRKGPVEDVPPLPQTPTVFATSSSGANTTFSSFSANETDSLSYVARPGPAAREELVVSGVSFMDLSDSSGDEAYQRPIMLNRLRRARSKTDLTAPDSKSSVSSLGPDSPVVDSPGIPMRMRRLADTKESAALRITNTNSAAAERPSLRPMGSGTSPLASRSGHDLDPSVLENPPLDPDFEFNKFMTSNKTQETRSPRSEVSGLSSKASKSAPPVDMPCSRRYETISVQATRESVHGYASFLSKAKTHGLPMPDMIDEDEGEWDRAVEWVRGQEAKRVVREAKAAKDNRKIQKSEEAQQAQKEADWQDKIGLARQFIRRTSTAWAPHQDSDELRTDEARRDAIAEALDLASKDHSLDPGFTELRKRFFAGISNQFSKSYDSGGPQSAPLPCRPGWMSPTLRSQYSSTSDQQCARRSTEKVSQQVVPLCPVSAEGPSPFEPPQRPLPDVKLATKERENAHSGLGIHMKKPPDPDIPPEPTWPISSDSESQHQLQSSAEATLANARIFKVDRDSKIQDRWAPKRCSNLYQTIDAARELAEARMGISPVAADSPTFPQKYPKLDVPSPSIKKVPSAPSQQNMFKRAAKHPSLRAMVSSLSMRSPDATEMISLPLTPTSNHPAFRSSPGTPVTPTAAGHRQGMAQRLSGKGRRPRASTSATSDDLVSTPLSVTFSESSSQKSSHSTAMGEERWAQRIRQKMKAEQAWQEHGVISPPVKQMSDLLDTRSGERGPSEPTTELVLQTPTPPACLPSDSITGSSSSPAIGQEPSPHLSRKTQDSPTPLNIKKFSQTPKVQLGLSLPDSPAPLQVSKLRPLVRHVLEQNFKETPETPKLPPSFDGDNDPFAKSGISSSKGDEKWPLSDAAANNAALEDHQALDQSPLDGQFDRIITSWRHASATQESLPPSPSGPRSADIAGKHKYVRSHLELDLLLGPAAGKAHPNHPYHWESSNVMCKDIHNARNSNNTAVTADGDDTVRFCSFCQEPCCYFGQQLGRAHIQTKGRDQTLEELKNKARSHVYFLRGTCPDGIEDYQTLMDCGLCRRTCCPGCASICQYPMCGHPVCRECVELEDAICGQH